MSRLVRTRPPWLCLVTDRRLVPPERLAAALEAAIDGGVDLVQLREKDLAAGELYQLALRVGEVAARRGIPFVVNDRLDVALAAGADGVHLAGHSLPVGVARAVVGDRLLVGRSVHGLEEALAAEREGADYVLVGTVYPSRSHPGGPTGGVALVESAARALRMPALAIGGITAENAGAVIRAGAAGVAVISAILGAPDPAAAARALRRAIDAAAEDR